MSICYLFVPYCDGTELLRNSPALIRSTDAMKCLLDAMLVITKQDRLCHVIHATSDPFYQTWLRQLNVMQHCKVCVSSALTLASFSRELQIITIGDYTKHETRRYFREMILPNVPEHLRSGLDFDRLYDSFGGKIAHWQDFATDYGKLFIPGYVGYADGWCHSQCEWEAR